MSETIDLEGMRAALETTRESLKAARKDFDTLKFVGDAEELARATAEVQQFERRGERLRQAIERIESEERAEAERHRRAWLASIFDVVEHNHAAAMKICPPLDHTADQLGKELGRVLALHREAHAKVAELVGPMAILNFRIDDIELARGVILRLCRAAGIDPVRLAEIEPHGWASGARKMAVQVEDAFAVLESRHPSDEPPAVATIVEPEAS